MPDEDLLTKEDMITILSELRLELVSKDLIETDYSSSDYFLIELKLDCDNPHVLMGLKNFDTLEFEEYSCSLDEFKEIFEKAENIQTEKHPEYKENIKIAGEKLFNKLANKNFQTE